MWQFDGFKKIKYFKFQFHQNLSNCLDNFDEDVKPDTQKYVL